MWPGKHVYVWNLKSILGGDPERIVDCLVQAQVAGVACKIHDGAWSGAWDNNTMMVFKDLCREAGLVLGLWGYIYLYNPILEARKTREMVAKYSPDYFLIDAEAQAQNKPASAAVYMTGISGIGKPKGLASYRFPNMHMNLPWQILRQGCDFDSPQVYYRTGDPVYNLKESQREFNLFKRQLPFFPAGDMYYEQGVKPRPEAVTRYLQACKDDPDIGGTLMWCMDQMRIAPELWQAFASFNWTGATPLPVPVPVPVTGVLYSAVVSAYALNIRFTPDILGTVMGQYTRGERVNVFEVEGTWAKVDRGWVALRYLTRL